MTENQRLRYERACHRMQTGVAFDQGLGAKDGSPKHLRVGINSAMSDHAGLAKLLMDKGVFTLKEYEEAIVSAMEEEALRYETYLHNKLGKHVSLG